MKNMLYSCIIALSFLTGCDDNLPTPQPRERHNGPVIIDRPSETKSVEGRIGWIYSPTGVIRRTDDYEITFVGGASPSEVLNAIDTVDRSECARKATDLYHVWLGDGNVRVQPGIVRNLNTCVTVQH